MSGPHQTAIHTQGLSKSYGQVQGLKPRGLSVPQHLLSGCPWSRRQR
jgi:hypothetical protein